MTNQRDDMKPIVVYHKDCNDGFGAAWCFHHFLGDCEFHPGVYQERPQIDFFNKDVYLVDFSYPRSVVEEILLVANSVTIIDHHKTAIEALWDLTSSGLQMHCNENISGSNLAWRYLNRQLKKPKPMPLLLAYINDRDLWVEAYKNGKDVHLALSLEQKSFTVWDKIIKAGPRGVAKLAQKGAILREYQEKLIDEIILNSTRIIQFEGEFVSIVNCPHSLTSDLCDRFTLDAPFVITYYDSEKTRNFSLRSNKDNPNAVDVSKIAVKYGGGGHKHAAGFKIERKPSSELSEL